MNVETLVSPRTGIVSRVRLAELAADDPPLHWAMSYGCDTTPIGGLRGHNDGNAAAATRERAVLKAVGESVERYCAAIYDEDELVLASFDELDGPATPPERFALFSEEQYAERGFRFPPFTRETVVRWVRGDSLVHGRPTWVPAQFVYVPYRCHRREPALHDLISTGLAAGPTFAWAAYRAALEPIERDAFSIVWNKRLARPRIDLAPVDDPVLDAFRTVPVRVDAVLLTLDIPVPVVLVVVQTTTDRPPLTAIGLGTDLSPARALSLALEEAGIGFLGMRRLAAATEYRPQPGYAHVTDLRTHGFAHAVDPALRASVEFLTAGDVTAHIEDRSGESAVANLRTVVDDLAHAGFDAVAIDLTTEDVDAVGYKVVRVVVPGLQPLDNDHTCRHLGGARLCGTFNTDPHPFP